MEETVAEVLVVGAGPIGLEVACELKRAGVDYVHVDKGQIAETISWFPQEMSFFSSTDRIALSGVPLQTPGQRKATKEEYLAYLRAFTLAFDLKVQTHEEVVALQPAAEGGFAVRTRTRSGERAYRVRKVVLAVGDMARPRLLQIPGEDLPHVSHYFVEPHRYFRKRLLVVGGKNSAVETALRCWHAGATVSLSYRRDRFDDRHVKYWLLPELLGRIRRGEIAAHLETEVESIQQDRVRLRRADGSALEVEADFVLLLVGHVADQSLFEMAGVTLQGESRTPLFDPETMETNASGVFVAGTASAGTQRSYHLFIENCHIHAQRIAAALTGRPPPRPPAPPVQPES